MKVILYIVLTFAQPCAENGGGGQIQCAPPQRPVVFEMPMTDAWDCLREANYLTTQAFLARRPGKLQAGCVIIGPETEMTH